MSFPTRLDLADLYRALGATSGRIADFSSGPIQPTALVADFSRGQTSESIESRAMSAGSPGPTAASFSFAILESRAGRPLVIEYLRVKPSNAASEVKLSVDPIVPLAGIVRPRLQMGGVTAHALFYVGVNAIMPGDSANDNTRLQLESTPQEFSIDGGFRIFVPANRQFTAVATMTNMLCEFAIVWRELPSSE